MSTILKISRALAIPAAVLTGLFGGARLLNYHFNDTQIRNSAYKAFSYSTGIGGHIEYVKFSDGSQEVKIYPNMRYDISSELHQDLNGDGLVDRIRMSGSIFTNDRLKDILVREYDYASNKDKFEEADKRLKDLESKFGN